MLRTKGSLFLKWNCCRSFFPITLRYSCLLLLCLWGCGQRAALSKLLACEKRHIHSLFAECADDTGPPDRHRRAVFQRLMRALEIVKLDPSGDSGFGLVAIRITLEIDVLVFERAPQPLDEHVVHPAPATVHRDPDAGGGQRAGEGGAGELAALVGIEAGRSAPRPLPAQRRRTMCPSCST